MFLIRNFYKLALFQIHIQSFEMTNLSVLASMSVKKYVRHVKHSFLETVPLRTHMKVTRVTTVTEACNIQRFKE